METLLNYVLQNGNVIQREWYNHPKYILKKNNKVVKTIWNKETCFEEAKKYKSRTEFSKKNQTAYKYARINKWLNEYTWFIKLKYKWNYETCFEEAKKYNTRSEFQKGANGAYNKSLKEKWIDDYTWFAPVNKR